jgi:hypothetical protein
MKGELPVKRYGMFLLILLLAACGLRDSAPTPTPDPLAFFAPTPISPGREQNPLRVMFVPPDPDAVGGAAGTLQSELRSRSGLAIEVVTVPNDGAALDALCDYNDQNRFVAAWLKGPSAVLALARECGDVALMGVSGGQTGLAGEIVGRPGTGLASVRSRVFCRVETGDFYSWTLPNLAMEAEGIDPLDIGEVDNYPGYEFIFEAIVDGNCAATGIPAGLLETPDYEEFSQQLGVAYTTLPMPYGVLIYPPELLLGDREALTAAFLDVVGYTPPDDADAAPTGTPGASLVVLEPEQLTTIEGALLALLGAENVMPATADDLAAVRAFMEDAGYDVAEPES